MTAIQLIRQSMVHNRAFLLKLVADMDDRQLLHRPAGGRGNNALWNLGHVFGGEARMAAWGGASVSVPPLACGEAFARGSEPSDDPACNPTRQVLLDYAAAVRDQTLAALDEMTDAELDQPPVGNAPPLFATRGFCWQVVATHEMMHAGQITVIRKELSLPPVLG